MILIERYTPKGRLLGFNTEGSLVCRECSKCGEYKEVSEFAKNSNLSYGYCPECKECKNRRTKEKYLTNPGWAKEINRRSYLKNSDKAKARAKAYREKNPEKVKAQKSAYCKRVQKEEWWQKKWKARRIKQARKWRNENREHIRTYNKKYKEENKDLCVAISIERENRKRKQESFSKNFRKETLEWFKSVRELNTLYGRRSFCVDHIIPLNHPDVCGLHYPENFQILTSSENGKKKNKFDGTYENNSWRYEL